MSGQGWGRGVFYRLWIGLRPVIFGALRNESSLIRRTSGAFHAGNRVLLVRYKDIRFLKVFFFTRGENEKYIYIFSAGLMQMTSPGDDKDVRPSGRNRTRTVVAGLLQTR
jgi:hypothetical protein